MSKLTVSYSLRVTADLRNVTRVQPNRGPNDQSFAYWFKVRCTHCHEESNSEVCVRLDNHFRVGDETLHLRRQCKACNWTGTIEMVPGFGSAIFSDQSCTMMKFKCHGLEPKDFLFGKGWTATLDDGSEVPNLDLTCGTYTQTNAQGELVFKISSLNHNFEIDD